MTGEAILTLNDKYLRLVGIPISVLMVLLLQMPYYFPGRWDLFGRYFAVSLIFTTLMWEITRFILLWARKRFPDIAQTRQRIFRMFWSFVLETAIGQALLCKTVLYFHWTDSNEPFWKAWLVNFSYSLFFVLLISGIYEAMYFLSQYKTMLLRAEELKKEHIKNKLNTLKNRVNPHFLFNSLTTLSALIGDNPRLAEQFVDELSKVYRYLLRAGRQSTMTLGEELDFTKAYTFLLQKRFGDSEFLIVDHCMGELETPEHSGLENKILPALTFQNALDYLVRTQNLPLKIDLSLADDHLQITSNNRPKTLAYEASDHDWKQLEAHGAWLETGRNLLTINIPFHPTTPAT